ncbi:MAG: hypothetical protein QW200_07660 [Ignisphaera sp.]
MPDTFCHSLIDEGTVRANGSYASSAYVLAVELAKGDESASLGLLNSSIPLASIIYNPLGGYISSSMGYKANFAFLSLLLVLSTMTFHYSAKRWKEVG